MDYVLNANEGLHYTVKFDELSDVLFQLMLHVNYCVVSANLALHKLHGSNCCVKTKLHFLYYNSGRTRSYLSNKYYQGY